MKFILIFLFFVKIGILKGQSKIDVFSIKTRVTVASLTYGEFITYIEKKKNKLKIFYSFRDSVSKVFYKDDKVKELLHSYMTENPEEQKATRRSLDSLENKYSYYSKDSLILKASKNITFIRLLEKIISTPKEELENIEASKKVHVLDGAEYSFIIKTSKETKYVHANQYIDPVIHPLLYQLYIEIQNIYKREKQNNFLDKMKTLSY